MYWGKLSVAAEEEEEEEEDFLWRADEKQVQMTEGGGAAFSFPAETMKTEDFNVIMSRGCVSVCRSDASWSRIWWRSASFQTRCAIVTFWRQLWWNLRICWPWLSGNGDGYYGNPDVDSGAGFTPKTKQKKEFFSIFFQHKCADTHSLDCFFYFFKKTNFINFSSCNQIQWASKWFKMKMNLLRVTHVVCSRARECVSQSSFIAASDTHAVTVTRLIISGITGQIIVLIGPPFFPSEQKLNKMKASPSPLTCGRALVLPLQNCNFQLRLPAARDFLIPETL